ncbi:MAG: MarR family transcriptional regulator [Chroococcidiopsidaceae cyanobacterium CP_BM_RX_35]|nr:MarR family transcriptional regulator [Chroococcidiopsidaceae cyanobacterium CP_BM_RX_35]
MTTQSAKDEFSDQSCHALPPHDLGYQLKLVSQLTYREFQGQLEPFGLTPFHYLVLCCLWQEDGLATSGIAEKLKQLGATLTGVLDRMEERDLVRRKRDPEDRRVWRVWLTEEGRHLREVLPPIAATSLEKCLTGISICDRERLAKILAQIVLNLS